MKRLTVGAYHGVLGAGWRQRQLLQFGDGGLGRRFYILQNNVVLTLKRKKEKLIEPFGSEGIVRFTSRTAGSIPVQPIFGLIDWIGPKP